MDKFKWETKFNLGHIVSEKDDKHSFKIIGIEITEGRIMYYMKSTFRWNDNTVLALVEDDLELCEEYTHEQYQQERINKIKEENK